MFYSCSTEEKKIDTAELNLFKTELSIFEDSLKNNDEYVNNLQNTIEQEDVFSEINEYDFFGIQYSQFLIDLNEYITINEISSSDSIAIRNYIEGNLTPILNNLSLENSETNEFEQLLLESFANNSDIDNVILFSKEYENFVHENFSDEIERKHILSTISGYKWIAYNLYYKNLDNADDVITSSLTDGSSSGSGGSSIACGRRTGIEYCLCKKLQSREGDWTWVDTAYFLATGAEQLAIDLASCIAAEIEKP